MKNKRGIFLMAAGGLLLFIAAILMCLNSMDERQAEVQSDQAVAVLRAQIPNYSAPSQIAGGQTGTGEEDAAEETQAADGSGIDDIVSVGNIVTDKATTTKMQSMDIDGSQYIGILDIPILKLSLPVNGEWSYPLLRRAPCRYTGSFLDNTMVIAGHNYRRHFGLLRDLKSGDSVTFTDVTGAVYRYEVISIETLAKNAVEEMETGDWDLTLFTCTPGGVSRVTVRCRRVL
jgi:sortase A